MSWLDIESDDSGGVSDPERYQEDWEPKDKQEHVDKVRNKMIEWRVRPIDHDENVRVLSDTIWEIAHVTAVATPALLHNHCHNLGNKWIQDDLQTYVNSCYFHATQGACFPRDVTKHCV